MTALTTAQRRVLTERGKARVETRRRLNTTGTGETYLTSDRRIGAALERKGLVTSEAKNTERYWVDPFFGGWRSTTDVWTEYRLTEKGIRIADELGTEALEEEER